MSHYRLFFAILSIFIFTGCNEKESQIDDGEVYINYWDYKVDSSAVSCEIEIANNELYNKMNFNDTTSKDPYRPRFWSSFSHSKIVIQGKQYEEIRLDVSKNALITWCTMAPSFLCNFRYDPKLKSLKVFDYGSKKFIDFRQNDGQKYFEKCLNEFKNAHNTK